MELKLRKFQARDISTRVDWINDPRIHASMFFDLPAEVDKTTNWFNAIQSNTTRFDASMVDADEQCLAMGGLTGMQHGISELYIMVHPEMLGKGIGSKALKLLCNYGFTTLNQHKIYLYTNDDNQAAYALYEKAGFQLEGVLRQHKFKDGTYINRRFYGMLRTDWEQFTWKNDSSYAW